LICFELVGELLKNETARQYMKKTCAFFLFLLLCSACFGQSVVSIDKIDNTDIAKAKAEVGFSAIFEGVVNDPSLTVYVMVYQPHLKAWRMFPSSIHKEDGKYRWRALCHFGSSTGVGISDGYEVKAIAINKDTLAKSGFPKKLPSTVLDANSLVLKRTK
jgi:hypothetical protein